MDRREFLRVTAASGGLLVGGSSPLLAACTESGGAVPGAPGGNVIVRPGTKG